MNFESGYPDDNNDSSNGQLLRDIEEISKALYLDHQTHQSSLISSSNLRPKLVSKKSRFADLKSEPKPRFDNDDGDGDGDDEWLREQQKPSSIWGWKPFKALSHIRQRKFTCCFLCHVHCVENLPSDFDGVSMSVHFKRKDNVLTTSRSRVLNGVVEFEETLMSKCVVYCMKSGHGNFVKYEAKHFLLYASIDGVKGLDVGKHWVDLTRLLPLTLEELEEDKCSGKWSTSFKLASKAKGATLHVSFAFLVTKDGLAELGGNVRLPLVLNLEQNGLKRTSFAADVRPQMSNTLLRRVGSVPSSLTDAPSDFSNSINMLYGKLEEGNTGLPAKFDIVFEHLESLKLVANSFSGSGKDLSRTEDNDADFSVVDKGIELEHALEEPEEEIKMDVSTFELGDSTVEVIDVTEIFKGEGISSDEESKPNGKDEFSFCVANDGLMDKHSIELLINDKISDELMLDHKGGKMVRSLSLDDVANAVADDFLNLLQQTNTPSTLSCNGDLESPRERLLREFEEDMTSCSLFLGADAQEDDVEFDAAAPSVSFSDFNFEGIDLFPANINVPDEKTINQSSKPKMKAKLLERLETQSLLQRWGLHEDAFQSPQHYSTCGFGSPVFVPPQEPVELPSLGEGLGPLIQLKKGGILRSMSPLLFRSAKNCGTLVLQASAPVVLPSELGSDIMEILQCIASVGIENLSQKLHKLMPVEEISGRTMQQLAWEATCKAEELKRQGPSQHESAGNSEFEGSSHLPGYSCPNSSPTVCDMVPEHVSIKDLAPFALDNIEVLMIEGLRIQSGMSNHDAPSSIRAKSATELSSHNRILYSDESSNVVGVRDTVNCFDELLDLSISPDEWLRLDAGTFGDENQVSETTLKVLKAHHAKSSSYGNTTSAGKYGFLGDFLTVGLMTQLRDPLRNYEPVGSPMLGLVQVERVYTNSDDSVEDKEERDETPGFRVNEVHVAGMNIDSGVPEIWASQRQQQAGSRWLLASSLTKNRHGHFSNPRSITTLSTRVLRNAQIRNVIWSITRLELSAQDPLIRNPDIIFPDKAV